MRLIGVIILSVLFFFSCSETDILEPIQDTPTQSHKLYAEVDTAFWPFFQRFEIEAQKRGRHLDLNDLQLHAFFDTLSNQAAGQCQYSSQHPERVFINILFWQQATEMQKEHILFHELGHCVLQRMHQEAQNEQGICLSIMRSGRSSCVDNYTERTRARYLDELFE